MSDTPTDEELDSVLCHHWPAFSMQAVLVQMWLRDAMRAALAKWGTPQPVNLNFTIENRAGIDVLVWKGGGCQPATSAEVAMWKALSAVQQPVVLEPLTDEQIRAMCKESWVFETVKQWVRITEQLHGITQKGGSNAE